MISVKYVSAWGDPSGYGAAARSFINALYVSGVNITLETIAQMPESTQQGITERICRALQNRSIPYSTVIIHLTPDAYPIYKEKDKYNIGHLFWETDRLPKEWIIPCNQMDEIWTASEQQAEMMRNSGVTIPIYSFAQPIDITKKYETIIPYKTNPAPGFLFYSIFQWVLRKNPKVLLNAYWKEFTEQENVTLLLKTYRITYVEQEFDLIKEDIKNWKKELGLKHYPKIFLTSSLLTDAEMLRLHETGDCYVNSSSGEGWSRPVQEAMLLGKPVISGNNGGITDYLSESQYYTVASHPVAAEVASWIPWYTADMSWKVLDEDTLRAQMRYIYDNREQAMFTGKTAQRFVLDNFSYQTVGEKLRQRLQEIDLPK